MPVIESTLEPLNYNDILLLPQSSNIESRDSINLYNELGYIPIFSAPMKNISELDVVIELGKLGGIGTLHRFFDRTEEKYGAVEEIGKHDYPYGISIGVNDWENELKYTKYAVEHNCGFVTIDTASGYLKKTLDAVETLNNYRQVNNLYFKIICGNVCDATGCINLAKVGTDIIRINIGTGLQCLTSKSIGIGCPPLTAIENCVEAKKLFPNIMLLADGGIYTPGDGIKALCFGSDGLMIGSLFGRAKETNNNGIIYGMSSYKLQDRMNKSRKSNEGTVTIIPKEEIRTLADIFNEFTYGLKSAMTYLGIDDINKIHDTEIEYIRTRQ